MVRLRSKWIAVTVLGLLNLALWRVLPAAGVVVDGYGECFQLAGTTNCVCEQWEFDDCDLCAILPCNDLWPQYCNG